MFEVGCKPQKSYFKHKLCHQIDLRGGGASPRAAQDGGSTIAQAARDRGAGASHRRARRGEHAAALSAGPFAAESAACSAAACASGATDINCLAGITALDCWLGPQLHSCLTDSWIVHVTIFFIVLRVTRRIESEL